MGTLRILVIVFTAAASLAAAQPHPGNRRQGTALAAPWMPLPTPRCGNSNSRDSRSPLPAIPGAAGQGVGSADLENDVAASERTVYRIGSITKQFTAAAILRLVEQGKLSLDDEMSRYLPSL